MSWMKRIFGDGRNERQYIHDNQPDSWKAFRDRHKRWGDNPNPTQDELRTVDTRPVHEQSVCNFPLGMECDVGFAKPGQVVHWIKVGEFETGRPIRMKVAEGERLTQADIDKKLKIMSESGWAKYHGKVRSMNVNGD